LCHRMKKKHKTNVVFIGAGNLATSLAMEMKHCGINIKQVYSRTTESAKLLADVIGCEWSTDIKEINADADLYIFAVKDTALAELISNMKPNKGMWVHTAGSMPISVFEGFAKRYGVLYPLQTFSKSRSVNFSNVPFLIEAQRTEDLSLLEELAGQITNDVRHITSEQRKQVHISAVFACNFTNHLYHIAWELLEEKGISPDIILPLISETAAKVQEMNPAKAQTGPAIRYDENVINKHLDLLDDEGIRELYLKLSESIHKMNK
jgi:Uncharacterized conserved protein